VRLGSDSLLYDAAVQTTRNINTTVPMAGGGSLANDLTLSVPNAGTSTAGLLKQLSGNATDYVGGDNACHALPAGLVKADVGIEFQEDFFGNGPLPFPWSITTTAGTTVSLNLAAAPGCDAANKGAGVVGLTSGSASNDRAFIYNAYGQSFDGSYKAFVPALGILDARFRIWIPSAIIYSSASLYSIMRFGLISDNGSGVIQNGIFFEYNYGQATTNWIGTTASAGTITRNASTTAVLGAQWLNLRLLTDATWANAYFYVNGTLIKTVTGFTLPANAMPLGCHNVWAAGTAADRLTVDWVYMKYSYSRGTW